ncbi:MAG: hypothetical protein MJ153_05920 [Clostridia bacterium]|nr:hypothetical protein [Clostridia bacterium]
MKTTKIAVLGLALMMTVSGCSSNTKESSNKHKHKAHDRKVEETHENNSNNSSNNNNGETYGIGSLGGEEKNPYFEEIDSAVITYYYGHNYMNMELFSEFRPTSITLDEDQIEDLENAFREIEEYVSPDESAICPITGYCKVTINDNLEVYLSDSYDACGLIYNDSYYFSDKDFTDLVYELIDKNNEEICKSGMFNKKVTDYWRNENNNSVEYEFDIEKYPELKDIKYYAFECSMDPNEFGDITDNFLFEDGSILMVFDGVGDAFYVENGFEYYITFETIGVTQKTIDEYLEQKAEMGDNDFTSNENSQLTIAHNGTELALPADVNEEDIISIMNECDFNHFDYLDDMDFGDCVEVSAGNGTFYIPTDMSDGNTYYVAEDGVRYLAWLDSNTRQMFLDII